MKHKKIMAIAFSEFWLQEIEGLTKEIFVKIFQQLPENTKIIGFNPYSSGTNIIISHESFPEVMTENKIPLLLVKVLNAGEIVELIPADSLMSKN